MVWDRWFHGIVNIAWGFVFDLVRWLFKSQAYLDSWRFTLGFCGEYVFCFDAPDVADYCRCSNPLNDSIQSDTSAVAMPLSMRW